MVSKAKNKSISKVIILTFCILIILLILVFGTNIFSIKTPTVAGNIYYSKEDVLKTAEISENLNIFKISKTSITNKLIELPYINKVDIKKTLPDKLEIIITEFDPIGYVPFSGTYLLIDKNGKVIDKLDDKDLISLPIIEGMVFEEFKMGENLDVDNDELIIASVEISNLLKKYRLTSQKIQIDVGNLDNIHLYIGELDVIIGQMNHLNKKIQWLSKVISDYNIGVLDLSNVHEGQAVMSPLK